MKMLCYTTLFLLLICNHPTMCTFGNGAITKELFNYIRTLLPQGKTILELGSGRGTGELAKYYTMFSVEHDPKYLKRYPSNYIYAPIRDNWYDIQILKEQLPAKYNLILVDGPPGHIGREGFFTNLSLFNTNVIIIFDDVNRKPEYDLMVKVANALQKPYLIKGGENKFGIILP